MKKLMITVVLFAFCQATIAQTQTTETVNTLRTVRNPFEPHPFYGANSSVSFWGSITDDLDLNHVYMIANASLFPDSTVKQAYPGPLVGGKPTYELGYTGVHAAGEIIDPKYDFSPVKVIPFNQYSLDSVSLLYQYFRGRNTTDTLLIQVYNNNEINRYTLKDSEGNVIGRGGLLKTDPLTGLPIAGSKTIRYLLEDKDSSNSYKRLLIPVGLNVPANGIAAVMFTFLPGYSYNAGDTLEQKFSPGPHKKLNQFIIGSYVDEASQKISSYNCGAFLTTQTRYKQSGVNSPTPGNFFTDGNHYIDVGFRVSILNVGEKPVDANKDAFSVYPNPLGQDQELHINWPFAGAAAQITISDIHLKTIYEQPLYLSEGNNLLPLTVSTLTKGCYLLQIRCNAQTITRPFFIH